jgi:hypothetical protein
MDITADVWCSLKDITPDVWCSLKDITPDVWCSLKDITPDVWYSLKDITPDVWCSLKDITEKTMQQNFNNNADVIAGPSGRAVYGVALRPLAYCHRGFESHRRHGCLSVVCVLRVVR